MVVPFAGLEWSSTFSYSSWVIFSVDNAFRLKAVIQGELKKCQQSHAMTANSDRSNIFWIHRIVLSGHKNRLVLSLCKLCHT